MKPLLFNTMAKRWINHKLVLSHSSNWYKIPTRKCAVIKVHERFNNFLLHSTQYSIYQLALLIKRNEHLLETILPIPSNPSYQNAETILRQLIKTSETIINQNNLNL